jgi:capsular exopolysaccharide synthesis family protein
MESKEELDLDLQKYWFILKRRWLPATAVFGLIVTLATWVAFLQKPDYTATGTLLLKKSGASSLTGLGDQLGLLEAVTSQSNPVKTETEVIRSLPLVQEAISTLNLKNEQGEPLDAEKLKKELKLKSLAGTDIVELSYKSKDPQQAAAVVNTLMSLYIRQNVSTNRAEARDVATFIAKELPQTEASLNQAETNLRRFKEQNKIFAPQEEEKSAVESIAQLENQITTVQAQLADANARFTALQNKVGMSSQQAEGLNSLSQSPGVQNALEELQKIEGQLALEQSRFLPGSPVIADLEQKRADIKALLQERITQTLGRKQLVPSGNLQIGNSQQQLIENFAKLEVERQGLSSRLSLLYNTNAAYKQRLNIIPNLQQQLGDLERKKEIAQTTYQTLLKKLQEVNIAEKQTIGNASINEPALVPKKAEIRKPVIIIALGGGVGILLGVFTIVLLELRDSSIKTLKGVKDIFGYIVLATIPNLAKKSFSLGKNIESREPYILIKNQTRPMQAEAYRMLQTNLKFLSSDKAVQVIVVTSSLPHEGKSTTSANLATAIAQGGRRVLLIDADMRSPSQHHIWELNNVAGLSDVLVGETDFDAVVNEGMPNLDVLTAGANPPNPVALIDSNRMALLIKNFSQSYDFVIVDAPPILAVADALILGKMTDGILFVSRPGVVTLAAATAAKEVLDNSEQNVLGMVVNGIMLENESDSYYYYTRDYYSQENSTSEKSVSSRRIKQVE